MIVSDNGMEMTSRAFLKWINRTGVAWHYIVPGKRQETGFVEELSLGRRPMQVAAALLGALMSSVCALIERTSPTPGWCLER